MKANELKVGDKFTWNDFEEKYGVFTVTKGVEEKYGVFTVTKGVEETAWGNCVTASSPKYSEGLFCTEEVTLVSTTQPRTLKELDAKVGDVVKTPRGYLHYAVLEGNKLDNLKDFDEPFCFGVYWDTVDFNLVSRTTKVKPQIEVGKTYKSQNGRERECIFVEGDLAWLKSTQDGVAYVWKLDGTPVSFGPDEHDDYIKFEPTICEGVDTISSGVVHVGNDTVSINGTVTTVDGVPDWTTYVEGN